MHQQPNLEAPSNRLGVVQTDPCSYSWKVAGLVGQLRFEPGRHRSLNSKLSTENLPRCVVVYCVDDGAEVWQCESTDLSNVYCADYVPRRPGGELPALMIGTDWRLFSDVLSGLATGIHLT